MAGHPIGGTLIQVPHPHVIVIPDGVDTLCGASHVAVAIVHVKNGIGAGRFGVQDGDSHPGDQFPCGRIIFFNLVIESAGRRAPAGGSVIGSKDNVIAL